MSARFKNIQQTTVHSEIKVDEVSIHYHLSPLIKLSELGRKELLSISVIMQVATACVGLSARFALLTKAEMNCLPCPKKIFKLSLAIPVQGKTVQAPSQFIPQSHDFFEQFENMAQTGKLADGWKCKYKILMRALPFRLKGNGKYFMIFSVGLQRPGAISEIFFIFSKKLTLF